MKREIFLGIKHEYFSEYCIYKFLSLPLSTKTLKTIIAMKKILLIVITLSTTLTLFAQRQMQVWQNGVSTNFAVDEVDSVTFSNEITTSPKDLLVGNWRNISSNTRRDLRFFDNDTVIYAERPYGTTVPDVVEDYGPWKYSVSKDSIVFLYEPVFPFNLEMDTFQYSTTYNIVDSILTLSNFSKDGQQFVHDIEFIKNTH